MNEAAQLETQIARCDREIAAALAEGSQPHTQTEHIGILLWEVDWRTNRAILADELAMLLQREAAA